MTQDKITSKILICEDNPVAMQQLKTFCDEQNLVALKVPNNDLLIHVLESNIDLGGIFLDEDFGNKKRNGIEIGKGIHRARCELPIFLRSTRGTNIQDIEPEYQQAFAGIYRHNDLSELKTLIDTYLFSVYYPNPLVRQIQEISFDAFRDQFRHTEITCDLPYLVKDQIIYGELMSLIHLESDWCRGYMMAQMEQDRALALIRQEKMAKNKGVADLHDLNSVLSEFTNLVWGAMKNKFFMNPPDSVMRTQVPIIVNHEEKYISFGSHDPQLCFRYRLQHEEHQLLPMYFYQRFIFNLSWSPDRFQESQQAEEELVETGELELF